MKTPKKILNEPRNATQEMMEGLVLGYDGKVGKVGGVIQVRISGGTSSNATTPRLYSVLATFSTSTGNTLVARMKLSILSNQ
mgnify:CR=1 FL=1